MATESTDGDALQRIEQRARLAVAVARLGTWHWRPDGADGLFAANERGREISGLEADAPVPRAALLARIHPGDRDRIGRAFDAALDPAGEGVLSEHLRFLHPDGEVRWAVARAAARFEGEGAGRRAVEVFGSLYDTTEQVSATGKYHALFDAIDRGFCVIEVLFDGAGQAIDYRFLETNPRFNEFTGLGDVVGRRMRDLAPAHEEHWFRLYGEVARTGVPVRFQERAEALGRWYDVYAYRVGDPLAHQVGVLFADITRRRQLEQDLLEADRRKDAFLATLAHELRNPLAPLRTALDVLEMKNDPATAARMHKIMSRQVDQIIRLADDLMEVSRITRGRTELRTAPLDLATVVRDAIDTSRPQLDASAQTLVVALVDTPLPVLGDAQRLVQVFVNLLNNAARYGRRGGEVGVRAWRDTDWVVATVRDDGIGIAADRLQTIFEPFTQGDPTLDAARLGLGIGLSVVRSLVERHGGEVVAHSEGRDRGSEFVVRLPLRAADG